MRLFIEGYSRGSSPQAAIKAIRTLDQIGNTYDVLPTAKTNEENYRNINTDNLQITVSKCSEITNKAYDTHATETLVGYCILLFVGLLASRLYASGRSCDRPSRRGKSCKWSRELSKDYSTLRVCTLIFRRKKRLFSLAQKQADSIQTRTTGALITLLNQLLPVANEDINEYFEMRLSFQS